MLNTPLIKPSTRRVQSNLNPSNPLATDAVFIAGMTATAYVFAYLFEMGYCRHFGIPFYLITATPTAIIFALVSIAATLSVVNQAYGLAELIFEGVGLSRLGFRMVQWIVYFAVSLALLGWTRDLVPVMVLITMMLFANYAASVPSGKEPLWDRLRAAEKAPNPDLKFDPLARRVVKGGRVSILVFNFLVLGSMCSFGVGAAYARLQTEFIELTTSPNTLTVRAYGDMLISIKYDPATKTATGETVVSKINEATMTLNVKAKVGPIQRPAAALVR